MPTQRIVGVVPAAGYALRLQPLPHSKELLQAGGRPVMDHVIEKMRAGGADEVRVVTRPEKEDVVERARELGVTLVLAHPPTLNASFAAGLAGLAPADIALLGFPDSIWEPLDGFRTLVDVVLRGHEVALGLFRTPGLDGVDYVVLDEDGGIAGIDIKPAAPRSEWMWGVAAARARVLDGLERQEWPGGHFLDLRDRGLELHGVRLSSTYLDVGTPSSLAKLPAYFS
jgi:glucose-1-phosphate thymidylyltransferase